MTIRTLAILFVFMVAAKLTDSGGAGSWSWWFIFSPLLASAAIFLGAFLYYVWKFMHGDD